MALGLASSTIDRRLSSGAWERLFPGVYRMGGAPPSWRQQLMAARLAMGEGAVVSHRSAAALFEMVGFPERFVEMTVPRSCRRAPDGIAVHRTAALTRADVTVVDAIPVTTPARTLVDLATCIDRDTLEEALDDALRRRLVSLPTLRRRGAALGARKILTQLVEQREHGVPESRLETRVLRAIRAARLPKPVIQHRVGPYRVDFAYPTHYIAIECDGYKYHSSRRSFDADRARGNALLRAGWTVLRVTWSDIDDLIVTLRALIA
jgi:very-short-patch-repair endonuclease